MQPLQKTNTAKTNYTVLAHFMFKIAHINFNNLGPNNDKFYLHPQSPKPH